MKKIIHICILSSVVVLLLSCQTKQANIDMPINFTETYLMNDMNMLSVTKPDLNSQERLWYFNSYASVIKGVKISSGTYPSQGELLAAHMFEGPDTSKGTIIMIHGYNGSSLYTNFQYFAQQMVIRGYRAIALDLPGHGFSGGLRGDVNDFSDYRIMLKDFLDYTDGQLGDKIILMGLSTGAIAIYDAYVHFPELMESKITASVLLSPFSDLDKSGLYYFGSGVISKVGANSHTPMSLYALPSRWIRKQVQWSNSLKNYQQIDGGNLLLEFGLQDEVMKLSKSIAYYTEKIKNLEIKTYQEQDHAFGKEGYKNFRTQTLDWMLKKLEDK